MEFCDANKKRAAKAAKNGLTCSDGSACTTGDACTNGKCVGGTPVSCDDKNACTLDKCDPSTAKCFFVNTDGFCEDGTGFLESQLLALDGKTGDPTKGSGLLLAADKCAIFEINADQKIDAIGNKTQPCLWDMTLTIGGKPEPIKSKFYATRQQ